MKVYYEYVGNSHISAFIEGVGFREFSGPFCYNSMNERLSGYSDKLEYILIDNETWEKMYDEGAFNDFLTQSPVTD